jgi:UDP-N-acetylglucosamine 4,6-dehydratase
MFVVQPAEALWFGYEWQSKGEMVMDDFRYASNNNSQWLSVDDIRQIIAPFENANAGV